MSNDLQWRPYDPFGDEPLWAHPPFPTFALDAPDLGEGTLSGCVTAGSQPVSVELRWGDPLAAFGPAITVYSTSAREWAVHEPNLADVLATERRRLYEDPDAGTAVRITSTTTLLPLGDENVLADIRREGTLWAARTRFTPDRPLFELPPDRVVVTVVGRGIPYADLRLRKESDLTAYLARRRTQLRQLAAHDIELAGLRWTDERLAAHFALVDYEFADDPQTAVHCGMRPNRNWDWGQQLWDAAVCAHITLTGSSTEEAEDALNSMVSHVLHLSGSVTWFDDARQRKAAIEEIVRFTVDGGSPPSIVAQEAWRTVWERRMAPETLSPLFDDASSQFDASFAEGEPSDQEWLAAWLKWRAARGR